MKTVQISFIFGFLLVMFCAVAKGFHFYGPYDVYKTRAARWQGPRVAVNTAETGNDNDNFLNPADSGEDYFRIISHLNDVGKRRR